jgi:hypothetical protein
MPDDRLNEQASDRTGDPQNGQFFQIGAERLKNAARIDVLQTPNDLYAEQAKAHVRHRSRRNSEIRQCFARSPGLGSRIRLQNASSRVLTRVPY